MQAVARLGYSTARRFQIRARMLRLRSRDIPSLHRTRRGPTVSERPDADLDDAPRIPRAGQNAGRPRGGVTVESPRGRAGPAQDLSVSGHLYEAPSRKLLCLTRRFGACHQLTGVRLRDSVA